MNAITCACLDHYLTLFSLSKPPFTLKVELFAKRTSHADDLPVAVAEVQLNPHSSDAELSGTSTTIVTDTYTEPFY